MSTGIRIIPVGVKSTLLMAGKFAFVVVPGIGILTLLSVQIYPLQTYEAIPFLITLTNDEAAHSRPHD